jgi:1A family penicillin-binding protein
MKAKQGNQMGDKSQQDMEKHHPTINSVPQTQAEKAVTPRQERALRYLSRKQIRHERVSQQHTAYALPAISPPSETIPAASTPMQSTTQPIIQAETVPSLPWKQRRKLLLRHLSRKRLRQAREQEQHKFNRVWLIIASVVLSLLVIFLSISSVSSYIALRFYLDTQTKYVPRIVTLKDILPRDNMKIYDRKGVLIAQLMDDGLHTSVSLKDVSPHLINATVATEDKNFWTNPGIDLFRIIRAAIENLRNGHVVEGGSTITQQLIKILVVGDETTMLRKLEEVALTPELNRRYSKQDILEMYLNSIYYGQQAYGVNAAATVYFGLEDKPGKPAASQLTLAQAAMIAGIPNSPYEYDPLLNPQAAFKRFQIVLAALVDQQYITRAQALNASKEAQSPHFFKRPASLINRAPHFVNFVLSELQRTFHLKREQLSRSDMSVYTTLDIVLQDNIQKIAQQHIAELQNSGYHVTNAAEVLIDYRTGAIISLLGSIDYNSKSIDGQFDVATQSYRQPGSSFKPYVYVAAFEQGISPAQAVNDAPLTISLPGANPPTFTPLNYDRSYHGHMTLRCALQNSLNIPAVKVLQHVGIDTAVKKAQQMGITSYSGTPGYSLVLGGLGVRLIDHTSAFGTFANNGVHTSYYAVEKVVFSRNHKEWRHPHNAGKQVISPQHAYMMTNVLSDNTSRLPQFYECNILQLYSNSPYDCNRGNRGTIRPAAVKTGTTNDFRDNWTMGYTTDYVMGVWAGNNDNSPMGSVSGVVGAAPIWHDAMLLIHQDRPVRDFPYPGGLQRTTVTYPDGVRATDWFLPGTIPTFQPMPTPRVALPTPTVKAPDASQNNQQKQSSAKPYCPSSYSFAFPPPADAKSSSLQAGWW